MDSVVSDVLDDIAQIQHKKRKFKASKSNNWLTPEALSAKRRRRKLERAWQRTGTAQSYEKYRKHCRATNRLITESDSRKKHFADKVKSSENSKQRWSTIPELLHPPRTPCVTNEFFEEFSYILETLTTFHSQLLITGDFNIHMDDPDDVHGIHLSSLLRDFDLKQSVNNPTHNRGRILDMVITRSDCEISSIKIEPPSLSDYALLIYSIQHLHQRPIYSSIATRGWKNMDREQFRQLLRSSPLHGDLSSLCDV